MKKILFILCLTCCILSANPQEIIENEIIICETEWHITWVSNGLFPVPVYYEVTICRTETIRVIDDRD